MNEQGKAPWAPRKEKKKKSVKKKFCKALFTTYLDSLFSIIKRTTLTRVEKHLCSSRLLLSCYQWLLTKQWQFNGIFMNSSSKGSEKQATSTFFSFKSIFILDAICQHVVLRCSLNGGDNCIPLWAHAMMQSALSKQKSQPASHFADNSQASPLRGSRSSVRFCVGIYNSCINMAGVTEITGLWNIAQLPEEFTGV